MVTLNEDLLIDAGGWAVLKEARGIHAAGKVSEAKFEAPLLIGMVRGASTEFRSGLRIVSKTDIENLCTCMESRRRGLICAHSIAVGLEVLKPTVSKEIVRAVVPVPKAAAAPAKPQSPFASSGPGTEILLHIILPPNFMAAWEKKSITVVVEAAIGNQRKPFATIDPKKQWRCDDADVRFLNAFLPLVGGKPASMAMLDRAQLVELLASLTGHSRTTFGKSQEARISEEGWRPPLRFTTQADGNLLLKLEASKAWLIGKTSAWMLENDVFTAVAPGLPAAYFSVLSAPVTIPAPAVPAFLQKEAPMLLSFFACQGMEISERPERIVSDTKPEPMPHLRLEGSLNFLSAKFLSGGTANQLARLRTSGFSNPDAKNELALKGEREILSFFATVLPKLEREWRVEIGERFQHVTREVERLEPRVEIRSSGEQWFDLAYDMQSSGGEKFSAADIARLLQTGQSHVKRPNGKVVVFDPALLDDFSQLVRDSNPEQRSPGLFRMQKRQAGALQSFADDAGLKFGGDTGWKRWSGSQETMQPVELGALEETMRPYQKQGVSWFNFLAQNSFGGILADEMGLGKTLQALAFLRTLKDQGPSLIVCPSSLIFNWSAEAARWVPDLNVLVLEGSKRGDEFSKIAASHLVITSYPLLRVDVDRHRLQMYAAVILDEAQHIKNPDSQNAKAATALNAKNRFVLTGTPVENSVRDLWSLMHFLMPGYLGKRADFKERYENPISKQTSGSEQQRLSRRIAPFLLRRTKKVVAKELPDKLEQIAWCELTPTQREIYTKLAESTRKQLSDLAGGADQKKSRMVMLTALLRLRQAACDARLLGMDSPPDDSEASAKLDMLMELLEEAVDGGHRVLIFSQFVTMLGLIKSRLEAAEMEFCYLDGQSKDRAAQVQKFQAGETPIFLISLKAGGTGLNLTAADTVIHFDPWWNPAVEAQATDRAHRIGQKNVVTSYKLIARGTVEEKILNLQEKKKSIIAATLESEQPMMDGLTLAEIEGLLE